LGPDFAPPDFNILGFAKNYNRFPSRRVSADAARENLQVAQMIWSQKILVLVPKPRGFHLITQEIVDSLTDISRLKIGFLHVFIQHTSASITLNENADPDVRIDMEMALNRICPEDFPFVHTSEGPDDMPAHVKSSLMGNQLLIPIGDGQLKLGTWQGIYLCEHRVRGDRRRLVLTTWGSEKDS